MICFLLVDLFISLFLNVPSYLIILIIPYLKKQDLICFLIISLFYDLYLLKTPFIITILYFLLYFINQKLKKKIKLKKYSWIYIIINYLVFFIILNGLFWSMSLRKFLIFNLLWVVFGIVINHLFKLRNIKFSG